MIETNARILAPGMEIALPVRRLRVQGTTNTPELRERVCYRLRKERGLIAVPCQDRKEMLLAVADSRISARRMNIDDWALDLSDTDEATCLNLSTVEGKRLLPELVERMMTHAIYSKGLSWSFDSLRIWYENKPFQVEDGIEAYRRFALSVEYLEGAGLGVAINVETAFFTQDSVADFFVPRVPPQEQAEERKRRLGRFETLTRRQKGQHGTLLYDNGITSVKCYFESVPAGKTCENTRPRKVRGKEHRSLIAYYQEVNPDLKLHPDTPVAMVSFSDLDHAQPVAANRLWIRVMNDELPPSLSQIDKIAPQGRRKMAEEFWEAMGDLCFPQVRSLEGTVAERSGQGMLLIDESDDSALSESAVVRQRYKNTKTGHFLPGFWRPESDKVHLLSFPSLVFRDGRILEPPEKATAVAYKAHFKQRHALIEKVGAYYFPPVMSRSLVALYPENDDLCYATEQLMESLCERLQIMTGRPFDFRLLAYESLEKAVAEMKRERQPATTIFVLNEEPEAYAEVALGLPEWKVKRITRSTLRNKYRDLTRGARPLRGAGPDKERGQRSWDSFLCITAFDVIQVMEGVPYRPDRAGEFEAQLVIDVSHDRQYYALSLLIAREQHKIPSFRLVSLPVRKPGNHETINWRMLKDDLIKFVSRYVIAGKDTPLASLLIVRDGRIVGEERDAIAQAIQVLRQQGCLTDDARVEIAELHKQSETQLRMWDVDEAGGVANVLEGTAIRLSSTIALLATTGAGTLRQGTADPMLIVVSDGSDAIDIVTEALGAAAHLNWSSPEVAQRLPMPFKRTDEVLKARSEQEIRRIR